jgi:hypothetical protein
MYNKLMLSTPNTANKTMSNHKVILWEDGKPIQVHLFRTPEVSEPGFYRAVTSVGAFSTREKTKLYDRNRQGHRDVVGRRCHVRWGEEIKWADEDTARLVEQYGRKMDPYIDLPIFHHESLWDFYKAIGYDYKKKKYLKVDGASNGA